MSVSLQRMNRVDIGNRLSGWVVVAVLVYAKIVTSPEALRDWFQDHRRKGK